MSRRARRTKHGDGRNSDVAIAQADSSVHPTEEDHEIRIQSVTPSDTTLANRVFVGNISYRVNWRQLKEFFSKFGQVVHTHVVTDHTKKWSKGIGFVSFSNSDAVEKALNADEDDLYLDHRLMRVSRAVQSRKAGFGVVMAAEREQKLRHQHEHGRNDVMVDEGRTVMDSLSPKLPKKLSDTGKQPAEIPKHVTTSGLKENQSPKLRKQLKLKKSLKKTTKSSCGLSALNNDVMFEIFSYLPVRDRIKLERVCKHWRGLLHKLWLSTKHLFFDKSFSIFRSKQGLTDNVLEAVVAKGSGELLSLDLSAVPHLLTDHALSVIGVYCPKLTTLDLSGVAVTMKSMSALTLKCEHLKWLRLQRCHNVTEKCLWWIFSQCKHLEHIDVSSNRNITGQCFVVAPKSIKSLVLADCQLLSSAGVSKLAEHCPSLEMLVITKCFSVDDQAIRDVLRHCVKLKELQFSVQNTAVKSTGFACNALKDLTVLVVSGHRMFNDEALIAVSKTCLQLRELQCATCYSISDVGVSSMTSCTMLTHLDICYCSNVTDSGFIHLVTVCQLQNLLLRACQGITDTGICCLASNSSSLSKLDLSGCMSITNKSLEALQENLLFGRESKVHLDIFIGGTLIDGELVRQFAIATGSSVCHHDLSIPSLAADYDPLLDMPPLTEESWEASNKQKGETLPIAAGDERYGYYQPDEDTITTEQAMDLLMADEPAYHSDEFSNPDDYYYDDGEGNDSYNDLSD